MASSSGCGSSPAPTVSASDPPVWARVSEAQAEPQTRSRNMAIPLTYTDAQRHYGRPAAAILKRAHRRSGQPRARHADDEPSHSGSHVRHRRESTKLSQDREGLARRRPGWLRIRSTVESFLSSRARSFCTAGTGRIPNHLRSDAGTAMPTIRARGVRPFILAPASEAIDGARPRSFPRSRCRAGGRTSRPREIGRSVVFGSRVLVSNRPLSRRRGPASIGAISAAKKPRSIATAARC